MKKFFLVFVACIIAHAFAAAQEIQTVFKGPGHSGGYGAITNKFTSIRGDFANIAGIYGGWYLDKTFFIGLGAAGLTNDIRVPAEYSLRPNRDMSYLYAQAGLVNEWVIASDRVVHAAFNLFAGGGFTAQYERYNWDEASFEDEVLDENTFFVIEPGVQVEVNLFKWMRFCPGVSYRQTFGSEARGLRDEDLSNISYNATLKFGKF